MRLLRRRARRIGPHATPRRTRNSVQSRRKRRPQPGDRRERYSARPDHEVGAAERYGRAGDGDGGAALEHFGAVDGQAAGVGGECFAGYGEG